MIHIFSIKCITFAFAGFFMGLFIDYTLHHIQNNHKLHPLTLITLQLLTTIIIFYAIDNYISSDLMDEIQTSIAGIFFVVMYFNAQLNFNVNIKKLLYNNSFKESMHEVMNS